ncbi:MAG: AMP-binding protein [Propionibacteriaceae bacterium]|nr:AMP-binding protein [Propionibacteriaceae bacterium]
MIPVRRASIANLTQVVAALLGGEDIVVIPEGVSVEERDLPEGFVGAVVSTSGSTGDPKSVMLSRSALLAAAHACHERLGGPGVWVNPLSVLHVGGLMTVVRAVVAGCPYVCTDSDLGNLPKAQGRAYLSIVPTQLHRALSNPTISATMATYSAVLVGGQGLDPTLRTRAEAAGIRVVETYGMSETCGGVVYDGVPLAGVVPFVETGRIGLRTPTAFTGYVGLPELTETILRDGAVLTSDRGTWDGHALTITGRVDDVVVSGGVNVDLAALQRQLDDVFPQETACFAVSDEQWGVIIAVASTGPDLASIQAGLAGRVESAARPRLWMGLDALPSTDSGKMDRRALVSMWKDEYGERA